MAARGQATSRTPTALAGITVGESYYLQNVGRVVVYMQLGTGAPGDTDTAFKVAVGADIYFQTDPGEDCYVWSTSSSAGRVVYEEAL